MMLCSVRGTCVVTVAARCVLTSRARDSAVIRVSFSCVDVCVWVYVCMG